MIVHASSAVTLSYRMRRNHHQILGFDLPSGRHSGWKLLPQREGHDDQYPARRTATLVISESTFGTSLSVRLSARVR